MASLIPNREEMLSRSRNYYQAQKATFTFFLGWQDNTFNDTTIDMKHGMLPFLLPLGKRQENTLDLSSSPQKTLQQSN